MWLKARESGNKESPWPSAKGPRWSRSCPIDYVCPTFVLFNFHCRTSQGCSRGRQSTASNVTTWFLVIAPRITCLATRETGPLFAEPVTERIRPTNGQWIARGRGLTPRILFYRFFQLNRFVPCLDNIQNINIHFININIYVNLWFQGRG